MCLRSFCAQAQLPELVTQDPRELCCYLYRQGIAFLSKGQMLCRQLTCKLCMVSAESASCGMHPLQSMQPHCSSPCHCSPLAHLSEIENGRPSFPPLGSC